MAIIHLILLLDTTDNYVLSWLWTDGDGSVPLRFSLTIKKKIMEKSKLIMSMVTLLVTFTIWGQNSKDKAIMEDAKKAKQEMLDTDAGLDKFFKNATAYVIFPQIGEGAFIIGGATGNGVLYENGKAVGMANLKKLDIGAQAGGQSLAEVIFFETEDALNEFKSGNYAISAEASAIAIKSGVAENANYDDGVVIFTYPKKGLMADVSVGGQKFTFKPF